MVSSFVEAIKGIWKKRAARAVFMLHLARAPRILHVARGTRILRAARAVRILHPDVTSFLWIFSTLLQVTLYHAESGAISLLDVGRSDRNMERPDHVE